MPDHLKAAEDAARLFHETYERLAPEFGYETRAESAVPWEQVPEKNRLLMTAVAAEVRDAIIARRDAEVSALDGALRGILDAYRLVEDTSRDVFVRADAERLLRQSISIARALMPFTKEAAGLHEVDPRTPRGPAQRTPRS